MLREVLLARVGCEAVLDELRRVRSAAAGATAEVGGALVDDGEMLLLLCLLLLTLLVLLQLGVRERRARGAGLSLIVHLRRVGDVATRLRPAVRHGQGRKVSRRHAGRGQATVCTIGNVLVRLAPLERHGVVSRRRSKRLAARSATTNAQ